ncbi:unnamed protein product [Boreogadus saida]
MASHSPHLIPRPQAYQKVTKVNDKQDVTEPYRHLVISVHRIMLACCLLVIIILILIIHYRTGKLIP